MAGAAALARCGAVSGQCTPAARSAAITSRLCRSAKKRAMLSASTGPTSRTSRSVCLVGREQRVEAAEMAREVLRRRFAHVPDAERHR